MRANILVMGVSPASLVFFGNSELQVETYRAEQLRPKNRIIVALKRSFCKDISNKVIAMTRLLAGGRKWIGTIGIAVANTTIPSVNINLATLVASDVPRDFNRFLLSIKKASNLLGSRLSDRPFVPSGDNMLTLSCHQFS